MKTSVLINCYNYADYVGAAIDSVHQQTQTVDELIIVDDGSTDDSAQKIEERISGMPYARLVRQPNQGQLSAFDRGVSEATGDLIFFLDADDCYLPHHVASVVKVMKGDPRIAFYFCAHRMSNSDKIVRYKAGTGDLGPSALLTYLISAYVGSITSAMVINRKLTQVLFPFGSDLYADWITEADNCLIFGASLSGFKKYFEPEPGFTYRIHENNYFQGRTRDEYDRYLFYMRRHRLLTLLSQRFGLTPDLARRLHSEFRAIPAPSRRVYRDYVKALARSSLRTRDKLSIRLKMATRYYLK